MLGGYILHYFFPGEFENWQKAFDDMRSPSRLSMPRSPSNFHTYWKLDQTAIKFAIVYSAMTPCYEFLSTILLPLDLPYNCGTLISSNLLDESFGLLAATVTQALNHVRAKTNPRPLKKQIPTRWGS